MAKTEWKRGNPWTKEACDKVWAMYTEGVPVKDIAHRLDRSEAAIRGRIRALKESEKTDESVKLAELKRGRTAKALKKAKAAYRPGPRYNSYLIKKTTFAEGRVEDYKELPFSEYGSTAKAWKKAMSIIRWNNTKDKSKGVFYWIKYR